MKTWILLGAMTMALAATAKADGIPEFGPTVLQWTECSKDGFAVEVHAKVLNFSPYDMELPEGAVWATKEENAAAAKVAFQVEFARPILALTAEQLKDEMAFQDVATGPALLTRMGPEGKIQTKKGSVMDRVLEATKQALMKEGKYSGMAMNYAESGLNPTERRCEAAK